MIRNKNFKFLIMIILIMIITNVLSAESKIDYKGNIQNYNAPKKISLDKDIKKDIPSKTLSLAEVLILTLKNNPEIKNASWEIKASKSAVIQEYLWDNPEIEFELENFGINKFSIGISQLIDLGFERYMNVKQAKKNYETSLLDFDIKRLELIADVTKQFINVLNSQEKLLYHEKSLKLAEEFYQFAKTKEKSGAGSKIDSLQAEKELLLKQHEKVLEEEYYYLQKKILASFWGDKTVKFENVNGKLDIPEKIPSINNLLENINNSPGLQKWLIKYEIQKFEKRKLITQVIPDITLSFTYERSNDTGENTFFLGGGFVLPLLNFNNGSVKQAAINLHQLNYEKELLELQIQNDLSENFLNFKSAFDKIKLYDLKVLKIVSDSYEESKKFYRLGRLSTMDFLIYQNELIETEMEYIELLTEFYKSKLDLELILGSEIKFIEKDVSNEE